MHTFDGRRGDVLVEVKTTSHSSVEIKLGKGYETEYHLATKPIPRKKPRRWKRRKPRID